MQTENGQGQHKMRSTHRRHRGTGRGGQKHEADERLERMARAATRLRTGYYLTANVARATALQMIHRAAERARPDSDLSGV